MNLSRLFTLTLLASSLSLAACNGDDASTGSGTDTETGGSSGSDTAASTSTSSTSGSTTGTMTTTSGGSTTGTMTTTSGGSTTSGGMTDTGTGGMTCPPGVDPCETCISMNCCNEAIACFDDADCFCFFDTCDADPGCAQQTCGITNPGQNPAIAGFFQCVAANCTNECQ